MLKSIDWNMWFFNEYISVPDILVVPFETESINLANEWLALDMSNNKRPLFLTMNHYLDIQKIIFLTYLFFQPSNLSLKKLKIMSKLYSFHTECAEIR